MSYKNTMRFMFSEAELCPEKENNKKIIRDGLTKYCVICYNHQTVQRLQKMVP